MDALTVRCTRAGPYEIASREVSLDLSAPAMVFVHGLVASSRYMEPVLRVAGTRYPAFAPDLPGWGLSTKPDHILSIPALADALDLWMEARGVPSATVVANSFGCQVAAAFTARHRARVRSLVLLGPTVDPAARTPVQQIFRLIEDVRWERPSLWPVQMHDLWDMGLPRALGEFRVMLANRLQDALPAITVPLLVARGSHDPIASQKWVEEVASLAPRGRWQTLPGAPHAANYSAPKELFAAIQLFLERNDLAAP